MTAMETRSPCPTDVEPGAETGDESVPMMAALHRPLVIGATTIAFFFGGLGGWAAVAPLASAAIASGVVIPDGSRRTVQHLEGGIVRAIRVQDGSRVTAGQVLVELDDTQARAQYEQLLGRSRFLKAAQVRLAAEQTDALGVAFPAEWRQLAHESQSFAALLAAQQDLFVTRRANLRDREAIHRHQISQLREQIAGWQAGIASYVRQVALLDQEIAGVNELLSKGLERKPRLLALQRAREAAEGEQATRRASIAGAMQAIGQTESEIVELRSKRQDAINVELSAVLTELAAIDEQVRSRRDVLNRVVITAPVAGTVVGLRHHTPGGVIKPGEPILDLVPAGETLLIDARVSPVDIDTVKPGLTAQVHLTPYRQRTLPPITGIVRTVSADSLTDPATGTTYYLARVDVDLSPLAHLVPAIELVPGMPAEVLIMTGTRSAAAYLLQPIIESLRRAFRDS